MNRWLHWIFTLSLGIAVLYLAVDKYTRYSSLHNEWTVFYPGEDRVFVESRVNLFKLRKLIAEEDATLKEAAFKLMSENIAIFPDELKNCYLDKTLGNLEYGILAQVYCDGLPKAKIDSLK